MKITVNGKQVEGDATHLAKILFEVEKQQKDAAGPFYYSQTKGDVPVRTLAEQHLKNAFITHIKDFYESLRYLTLEEFYTEIGQVYGQDEFQISVLYSEIFRRVNE